MVKVTLVAFLIFLSSSASAFIEVRGYGGFSIVDPYTLNGYLRSQGIKEIYAIGMSGVDVLLVPKFSPIGLGVRYDYNSIKTDTASKGDGKDVELQATNISGIINARMSLRRFYLGPIALIGTSQLSNLHVKRGQRAPEPYKTIKGYTYTLGVELGFYISHFRLGMETGYRKLLFTEYHNDNLGIGPFEAQLHGPYFIFLIGFGIDTEGRAGGGGGGKK